MGPSEYQAIAIGVVLPALISLLVREQDPPWFKLTMTYLSYAVVALVLTILNNEVTIPEGADFGAVGRAVVKTLVAVWGTADLLYRGLYKKTGLTTTLERVGRK